ncbi:MAG: hypothetical protein H6744_21620 [Deltaproteobacteria bacterium]|nr:hypothetical protein [Deltaproteobacteria bacterium]
MALGALLTDLEEREEPIAPWRVVLAIDADAGGDKACLDLFVALERSGASVVVHRAGPWPHGADLGDRLAALGSADTAREILEAGPYVPEAQAVVPAIYGEGEPMPLAEARAVLPGLVAKAAEAARTGARSVLAVPPGCGKTTAALMIPVERGAGADYPQVVIALASWELVRQKRQELEALALDRGIDVRISEWVGVGEACHNGKDPASGAPIRARDAFLDSARPASWRQLVCPACPLKPGCRAHAKPSLGSDVVFTVHASLQHLPPAWAERFVIIIDEAPNAVELTPWTLEHLRGPEEAVWLASDPPDTLDALDTLHRGWSDGLRASVFAVVAGQAPSQHTRRIEGRALGEALVGALDAGRGDHALRRALDALERASAVDPDTLPRPDVRRLLREGKHSTRATVRRDLHLLYGAALELMRAVREGREPEPDAARLAMVIPGTSASGPPSFELRQPLRLRAESGAVVLDATAQVTPHVHESFLGDEAAIAGLPVLPHPEGRVVRVHFRHKGLARSRILPAGRQTWRRLASVVRRAVAEATLYAGEDWAPRKAAIITYRDLVEALERHPADGPLAQWQAAVAGLASEPVQTGYFGGTSRASNAFEDVDVLVILGDPWPDLSGRRLDLAAMGSDPDEVDDRMRAEVAAELGQAMGRARAEVRAQTVLLIQIGSVCPAGWEGPSVIRIDPRAPGRPRAQDAVAWQCWLAGAAEVLGALSEPLIRALVEAAKLSAETDTKEYVSVSVSADNSAGPSRWVSAFVANAGPPPAALPSERRLRNLLNEATRGVRWRTVGSKRGCLRVREDLTDDEGRAVLAFLRALAEGEVPAPPDVSPRARWWWPEEPAPASLAAPETAAAPTVRLSLAAPRAHAANEDPAPSVALGYDG